MGVVKLSVEESTRRAKERSKKSNAKSKAKRDAERLLGIPAKKRPLSEKEKLRNRVRVKEWREKRKLLKPPRVKMTPDELALAKRLSMRRQYQNRVLKQGKIYKPNKIKMEKILKSRPANRISEKVIKPVKTDASKQTVCRIKPDDPNEIKVQLDSRTWCMAKPGYDINALRRKFLGI